MSSPPPSKPGAADDDHLTLPPIAALFVIRFDQRVGYTIAWHRAISGLDISGAVEYKSLPSGLHNVKEDLVYFVQDEYAGISAFKSEDAAAAERNARFVSVGVLVSRGRGRFGMGWLYADEMRGLACQVLANSKDLQHLERYWEQHKTSDAPEGLNSHSPGLGDDSEAVGTDALASGLLESVVLPARGKDAALSPYHPVLSIMDFLDTFGPLLFPLYRAALLRKRVLFITRPPILPCCNYVYILSVLASVPLATLNELPEVVESCQQTLFSIGVHDIPMLQGLGVPSGAGRDVLQATEQENGHETKAPGWIACTSDELLSTKESLSDVRIQLPNAAAPFSRSLAWPSITVSGIGAVRATQRDLRRYKALCHGLLLREEEHARHQLPTGVTRDDEYANFIPKSVMAPLIEFNLQAEVEAVEDFPWAGVIYNTFLWWASAGERSAELEEEYEQDRDLLAAASDVWENAEAYTRRTVTEARRPEAPGLEMAVIAYFHRMTDTILSTLTEIVEGADVGMSNRGEAETRVRVLVSKADLLSMGLDTWSKMDREFVVDLVKMYFGREADVEGSSIDCCGVRLY